MGSAKRAIVAVVLAVLGCGGGKPAMPAELLGRWSTDAPGYAGRTLSISSRSIVFASSATASENFAVRDVEIAKEQDGALLATISYGAETGDLSLRVRLLRTAPPALTLGDRPEKWTRVPGSGALP